MTIALALAQGTFACSSPSISCRVTTDDYTAPGDGTVTYTASVTGAGTVKSVVFLENGSSVTKDNPQLPFEAHAAVSAGAAIDVTVYGSIENDSEGNVLAGYTFEGNAGDSYVFSSTCR